MFIKKLISGVLCASMLLSTVLIGYANEAENSADVWNTSYVTEAATEAFEEFPMSLNKTLGKDMALSLQFQYLKNLSENDAAIVTIKDMASGLVVNSYELSSANTYIVWEDVANNKNYSVKINETINGVAKSYTGYISTKFVEADFPADVTLGNINYDYNHDEEYSMVAIKKVGVNAECLHEEDEECTEACTTSSVLDILDKEDLNSFYSSLDSNSFYEMQMDASLDGVQNHYQGFISTYPGGDELGIFTRGYEFSLTSPLSMNAQTSTLAIPGTTYSVNSNELSPSYYNFENATELEYYQEYTINPLTNGSDILLKWVAPETGSYTIETIGNLDTIIYRFVGNADGSVTNSASVTHSGGIGNNASYTFTIAEGQIRYFVLNEQVGNSGVCVFRIVRNDYADTDGIPYLRSVVQANNDNGVFSSPANTDCRVRFNGDVNIFAYNATAGTGYMKIENANTKLTATLSTVYDRQGGFDLLWTEGTFNFERDLQEGNTKVDIPGNTKAINLTAEIHYIDIKETSIPAAEDDFRYDFYFYDTRQKDADDLASIGGSDSVLHPVEVEDFPYVNTTRTLHRGDTDWFEIIASDGADLTAVLTQPSNGHIYGIELYEDIKIVATDPLEWVTPVNIGTITTDSTTNTKTLTYENLDNEHKYYLAVTRPNSSTYSSAHPYGISINAVLANPTATLSGNVSLTHTAGTDISDLTAMKNAVMENLTCTLYGEEVSDSIAVNDVELYYNGSILTASTVNSLTADEYAIVVKYKDVEATGGTVTLNVVTGDLVEDEVTIDIDVPVGYIENYDWLYCAKALADYRRVREGLSTSTVLEDDAAAELGIDPDNPTRAGLYKTYQAVCFFYTDGSSKTATGFQRGTTANTITESVLYEKISNGTAVIMQIADSTDTSDLTKMRYILITGVNKTTHQLQVYDCLETPENLSRWIDTSVIFNGGYDSTNNNIKFLGYVIEITNN